MQNEAIYAGTFDPVTLGHCDVIERAARIFSRLTVAVAEYSGKRPLFDVTELVDRIREVTAEVDNVQVEPFNGLLVEYARAKGIAVIVRGLRAVSDFEYEMQMALTNRQLAPDIETLFLMPKQDYSYVTSSNIRQIAELGGCTRKFVPEAVAFRLEAAVKKKLRPGDA
jgi:pantetheine-phosphate adenylyltransferase